MAERFRNAGVLLHVSSLPSKYGCGSFGKEARDFVDCLHGAGFKYWQVLPMTWPDEVCSPYSSSSSYFGNPLFIDLEDLDKDLGEGNLITDEMLRTQEIEQGENNKHKMDGLINKRLDFLDEIWDTVVYSSCGYAINLVEDVNTFINDKNNIHIKNACTFYALKDKNNNQDWQKWTCSEPDDEKVAFYSFIAYEFDKQWKELKKYAKDKGVSVIGDVPFYVNLQSSDVYFNRKCFQLNENGYPDEVSGVRSNGGSDEGQKWGHPLYNYEEIKKQEYLFFKDRFGFYLKQFDMIRIDHFRAFSSYDAIGINEKATEGRTVLNNFGNEILDVLTKEAGPGKFIAEDVGGDDKTPVLLQKYSIPGMKIIQHNFTNDVISSCEKCAFYKGEKNKTPQESCAGCFAYTGTHDDKTFDEFLSKLEDKDLKKFLRHNNLFFDNKNRHGLIKETIKKLLISGAETVILPMQDILGQGEGCRMNVPGKTPEGNWMYAMTKKDLDVFAGLTREIRYYLSAPFFNHINVKSNHIVDIHDYFNEIVITYHKEEKERFKSAILNIRSLGYRVHLNEMDDETIKGSEYEDKLDRILQKCPLLIVLATDKLLSSDVLMRTVWYQIGFVYPRGNERVHFYVDKTNENAVSGSPLRTHLVEPDKFDSHIIEYLKEEKNKYLTDELLKEKYSDNTDVNRLCTDKMTYRCIEVVLEFSESSIKEFIKNYYGKDSYDYRRKRDILDLIDAGCYLVKFSTDDNGVMLENYKSEIEVDHHDDFLSDTLHIQKRFYVTQDETDPRLKKNCYSFEILVPIHNPLGSRVKPYFRFTGNEFKFDKMVQLFNENLSEYERKRKDVVPDEEKRIIYFSFDFPGVENRIVSLEKGKTPKIGKILDKFYPQ